MGHKYRDQIEFKSFSESQGLRLLIRNFTTGKQKIVSPGCCRIESTAADFRVSG